MQGHATDAWDFLGSQKFSTAAGEAQRLALMASIRMNSWLEVRLFLNSSQIRLTFLGRCSALRGGMQAVVGTSHSAHC